MRLHLPALLAALLLAPASASAVIAPPGFVVENAVPGVEWIVPVNIQFFPGGRMLVAEKGGRLWTVVNGVRSATPLLDIRTKVLDQSDRGLLGIAIDPDYPDNHWIYVLYTVDPDSNDVDTDNDAYGRLERWTVSFADSNTVEPNSRIVLLGRTWREGPVAASGSHTIGSVEFGTDGSLLVSMGDGAQFNGIDAGGGDADAFGPGRTDPAEDIGAFRSQMLESLAGKVLRIDPATGHGYPNNPFWDGDPTSVVSRVWTYGVRNPFRLCVRPGSGATDPAAGDPGTLYLGDVGYVTFEEQNIVRTGGLNLGWPCREGAAPNGGYQSATPAHHGCGSIGTPENPVLPTDPDGQWHHADSTQSIPPNARGNAAVGGAFYTGATYPLLYRGAYFYADYGKEWIQVATVDSTDHFTWQNVFVLDANAPVDLTADPISGDLYYVSITTGEVRRIRYEGAGGNAPAVAIANGTPTAGASPLAVTFSSNGTFDPDGDPLLYSWNFGDGQGSTAANPSHAYQNTGEYAAVLSVDDGNGHVSRDTVRIIVSSLATFPTTPVLDDFDRPDGGLAAPWTGDLSGLSIENQQLRQTGSSNSVVYVTAPFGPLQEAFVTVSQASEAPEHNLMLKVQGTSWSSGHIEVRFDEQIDRLSVNTYTPGGGWLTHLNEPSAPLSNGEQVGARAFPNGAVQVFRNGVVVATADCSSWPFAALGGRLGMTVTGATGSRFDDFGGGSATETFNTPPVASVVAPPDTTFFFTGQALLLQGAMNDVEDPPGALAPRWEVDLIHNTHVHPSSWTRDSTELTLVGEDHDDGTGIRLRGRFIATDTGGLRDTAWVNLFPEVDLRPSAVATSPGTPGTTAPAEWRFTIANTGRMPSPFFHWQVVAGGAVLAEGDTLVGALDSVLVVRTLPPSLTSGDHVVRVVADSAAAIVEPDEADNAASRTLTVVEGPGPDEAPPLFTLGPLATPSGASAQVAWRTNEPASGVVRFGPSPGLGDSVEVSAPDTAHVALLNSLALGDTVWFRVVVRDTAGNETLSAPDSFVTQSGPLAAGDPPPGLRLSAAWPNPSARRVEFALELPAESVVEFAVFDVAGRQVAGERARTLGAGRHRLSWEAAREGRLSGLFFARVRAGGREFTRRFVLAR